MGDITLLKYSNTNTYLIEGSGGTILFDTGWAGTFNAFCKTLGDAGKRLQDISYILISHFHPDHMGIAQEIADHGPVIVAVDIQKDYLHSADDIFKRSKETEYKPIKDENVRIITVKESRSFLNSIGLAGELICTPGHSDDSISLWLDEGYLFVGDLNPLYELELHKGTEIGRTWERLLRLNPKKVYYGHARTAELSGGTTTGTVEFGINTTGGTAELAGDTTTGTVEHAGDTTAGTAEYAADMFKLVSQIIKMIDRGCSLEKIEQKTGADGIFIEDVNRMYLTHQNVGVQGILDRIEIKNR